MTKIKLVVFDMAGTTVDDEVDGVPLVLKSYSDAFKSYGVNVPIEILNEQRGRDKWTVISELGGKNAHKIYDRFLETLRENTSKVKEIDGASEIFKFLKDHGVKVELSTGFPSEVAEALIEQLRWVKDGLIDGWVCSEQVGASRPDPAMIIEAIKRNGVDDRNAVVKVDDSWCVNWDAEYTKT
jgi:phosphoglycolate phosphatase